MIYESNERTAAFRLMPICFAEHWKVFMRSKCDLIPDLSFVFDRVPISYSDIPQHRLCDPSLISSTIISTPNETYLSLPLPNLPISHSHSSSLLEIYNQYLRSYYAINILQRFFFPTL